MNLNELDARAKERSADDVRSELERFRKEAAAKEAATHSAADAFFALAAKNENVLRERLDALTGQLQTIEKRINNAKSAVMNATIAGDACELKKIRSSLSVLEAERAAISDEMDMLYTSPFPYDKEIYAEVIECHDAELATLNEINQACRDLRIYAEEQVDIWKKLLRDLSYDIRTTGNRCCSAVSAAFTSGETTKDYLDRRESEKAKQTAREAAVARQNAMLADLKR